ncbi:MAG: hypothetical protein K0S93_61 [Nitrososphaeraceae archaeon]|jgi:hypothetical protein|nr:hypothetical protein [Nitrososphaeraceae archaeon]
MQKENLRENLIREHEKEKAKKSYYENRIKVSKQIINSENLESSLTELEEIAKEKILKNKLERKIEKINKEIKYLESNIIAL